MRRAALWEASLRYAPFGFPKHKGTPIQNCIQSSCTTVYNLTLDRGRLSLQTLNEQTAPFLTSYPRLNDFATKNTEKTYGKLVHMIISLEIMKIMKIT